jgi:hypothetical protein
LTRAAYDSPDWKSLTYVNPLISFLSIDGGAAERARAACWRRTARGGSNGDGGRSSSRIRGKDPDELKAMTGTRTLREDVAEALCSSAVETAYGKISSSAKKRIAGAWCGAARAASASWGRATEGSPLVFGRGSTRAARGSKHEKQAGSIGRANEGLP